MAREKFGSRLGFLMVSAGCAIGIGNVWKFPFVTGQNGGGLFVLFYLLFLTVMAAPVLTMELAIGRASGQSMVGAYRKLEKPGQKWHLHGYLSIIGCVLLMSYYTTVSGWMLDYFVRFASGSMQGVTSEEVSGIFQSLLADPAEMAVFTVLVTAVGFFVCSFSLQKGVERVTKYMMIGLLLLIVTLAVHSLLLPGAAEGLKFYLLPDPAKAGKIGIGNVMAAAMNQAFFTVSIGIGSMEIFGSYMSDDRTLLSEAATICLLDTFVAIVSGLIIFPACFSFGVQPDQGPSLIFVTLPHVFIHMDGGRLWGSLFFLFMTFASLSTVIAVFENLMSFCMEEFHWTRRKAALVSCVVMTLLSLPSVLGFNRWSGLGLPRGMNILDAEDFLVSNLILPFGSIVYLLFCSFSWGWGFDGYLEETNRGKGMRIAARLRPYFRYVLPVLILIILIRGFLKPN